MATTILTKRVLTLLSKPSSLQAKLIPLRNYSTTPTPPTPTPNAQRPKPIPTPTNLPGSNLPPVQKFNPMTVTIITRLANMFGYSSQASTAIRISSDYYDRCAERGEIEAPFFYEECSLPPSFQTWFALTTLHVWLLSVRFRSLPDPLGRTYVQELINHFFVDIELRVRGPYAVTQSKLIKGYMRDYLEQYHGAVAAYDEGLLRGDAVLAAAIWRNVFGAAWGGVGGGVKGKRAPKAGEVPKLGPNPNPSMGAAAASGRIVDPIQAKAYAKAMSKGAKEEELFTTDQPVADPSILLSNLGGALEGGKGRFPEDPDLEFAQSLEKLVVYVRMELQRLERTSDENVMTGRVVEGKGKLIDFTRL